MFSEDCPAEPSGGEIREGVTCSWGSWPQNSKTIKVVFVEVISLCRDQVRPGVCCVKDGALRDVLVSGELNSDDAWCCNVAVFD